MPAMIAFTGRSSYHLQTRHRLVMHACRICILHLQGCAVLLANLSAANVAKEILRFFAAQRCSIQSLSPETCSNMPPR